LRVGRRWRGACAAVPSTASAEEPDADVGSAACACNIRRPWNRESEPCVGISERTVTSRDDTGWWPRNAARALTRDHFAAQK